MDSILNEIVGKTIENTQLEKISDEYDDIPFLVLSMTDGTKYKIEADYNGFIETGNSQGEYRRFISVIKLDGRSND